LFNGNNFINFFAEKIKVKLIVKILLLNHNRKSQDPLNVSIFQNKINSLEIKKNCLWFVDSVEDL
jgi:hypothetical protein